uniref:Uncharacterized protein n=1 Tax=Anopheles melas TaxID=34690 RepID=A0A182TMT0_9DIPT
MLPLTATTTSSCSPNLPDTLRVQLDLRLGRQRQLGNAGRARRLIVDRRDGLFRAAADRRGRWRARPVADRRRQAVGTHAGRGDDRVRQHAGRHDGCTAAVVVQMLLLLALHSHHGQDIQFGEIDAPPRCSRRRRYCWRCLSDHERARPVDFRQASASSSHRSKHSRCMYCPAVHDSLLHWTRTHSRRSSRLIMAPSSENGLFPPAPFGFRHSPIGRQHRTMPAPSEPDPSPEWDDSKPWSESPALELQ